MLESCLVTMTAIRTIVGFGIGVVPEPESSRVVREVAEPLIDSEIGTKAGS
jgi:hypothetical protein